jgi:hypothetical protein
MGTAHRLKEMMVVRLDGGAHQPQNEETTILNNTDKIIKQTDPQHTHPRLRGRKNQPMGLFTNTKPLASALVLI